MSTTQLNSLLTSSLAYTYIDQLEDGLNYNAVANIVGMTGLVQGSGDGEANIAWHTIQTLASGGVHNYDLHDLSFEVYNNSFSVSFSGSYIKGFIVKNNAEDSDCDIAISCTGVNIFNDPCNFGDAEFVVKRSSALLWTNTDGWYIDGNNRYFSIKDYGSGVNYELGIIGISGII